MFAGIKSGASLAVLVAVMAATAPPVTATSTAASGALGDLRQTSAMVSMTLAQAPAGLQAAVRSGLYPSPAVVSGPLQRARLSAADAAVNDFFGYSVAVSGSTAVVGAYNKKSGTGAAYVFVTLGTTWSQQAKLTASDGAPNDLFGIAVAISGSTALVGATHKNSNAGAAYVFVRSGTTWSQQAMLTASDGAANAFFGISVGLSGSSAVVGAYGRGAAYVFAHSGTSWSQQAELIASDGFGSDIFGYRVAISASTVVVGAWNKNSATGAAYVFVQSGTAWSQQAELTASDGVAGDAFGHSVSISGSTVLVGADGKSSNAGAAYVFVRSGTAWGQQAELSASDGVAGDSFGRSAAISGSTVVVGAYGRRSNTGAAYAFVPSGSGWWQEAELTASDGAANDYFGLSVALSGSTAVVGAEGKSSFTGVAYVYGVPTQQAELTTSDASVNYFGLSVAISGSTAVVGASIAKTAYVFVRSGTTWSQQARLTGSDVSGIDGFGDAVAISGPTVVVGAQYKNSDTGAAYVFVRSGTTWTQQAKLIASDGASSDFFGEAVAISASTVLIGAYGKGSGVAYAFVLSGTTWSQQAELKLALGVPGDRFGYSVAMSGSTAVVGAIARFNVMGAAYVFVHSGTAWSQPVELTASDGRAGDAFGSSVAISGSTVVVGAPFVFSYSGAAYVFTRSGAIWSQQARLAAPDAAANDYFGTSVAASGNTAVVGAYGKNSNMGAAYMFARSGTAWSLQAELRASDAAPVDLFGGSVAISGTSAVVGADNKNGSTGAAYVFVLP
jgi:hypothetical protein